MNILGLSCFYHDAGACLLKDGVLVAAASEERFSRRKHDSAFPISAIRYVLSQGEMDSFIGIEERFAVSAEEFSAHFGVTKGTAVSLEHGLQDINTLVSAKDLADAEDVYGTGESDIIPAERETGWFLNEEERQATKYSCV